MRAWAAAARTGADQSGSITSTTKIRRMMNLMTNTAAAATSTAPEKSSTVSPQSEGRPRPKRGTSVDLRAFVG